MKTKVQIENEIKVTEELLSNLKQQLNKNSKQVEEFNKKLAKLKELNPGDEVRLNKKCRKWYGRHGFESCSVAGVLKNEKDALCYVGDKLIEAGKYKLVFVEFRSDVGEGPGGKFEISYPKFNVPTRTIYFGIESLILKD